MADQQPTGSDEMTIRWMNKLVEVYGPFAFGIISLMVMWVAMIKPELESRRLEYEQHAKVLQTLNDQLRDQERVNGTIHETAIVLDRVVARLEQMQGTN